VVKSKKDDEIEINFVKSIDICKIYAIIKEKGGKTMISLNDLIWEDEDITTYSLPPEGPPMYNTCIIASCEYVGIFFQCPPTGVDNPTYPPYTSPNICKL
jgi:hypothetical protein